MNERRSRRGCLALHPRGLQTQTTFASRLSILGVGFSIFFPSSLISTWPLYSGVMCNADFGERCARPNQTSLIPPSPALSPPAPHMTERETQRHISTFVMSEWILISRNSMCFSWSVVGYSYCLCFCWQLSFIIVGLNTDQVDSETREYCRIGFLCRKKKGAVWPQTCFSWYNWYIFNSLVLYAPSSSAIQSTLWT